MIKLSRAPSPAELTAAVVSELTQKFKQTGDSVWQTDYIKASLLRQSHGKCSFCECELGIESKYLEVEHFAYKKLYPNEVVSWSNLMAACRRCNGQKGQHDVYADPIVDPYKDDPRHHMTMRAYRMHGTTSLGEMTISLLDLNNVSKATQARFNIGNTICDAVDNIFDKITIYKNNPTALRSSKMVSSMEALLNECQHKAPYAATAATILHKECRYAEARAEMMGLHKWNDSCEAMHVASLKLVL